jgi:thiol-disulfide isomerase/thioredoxin
VTSAARLSIAGLVLVVAAVVAIWPRDEDPPADPPTREVSADLDAARSAAGLEPCPSADPPAALRSVAEVRVQCLADGSQVDLAAALAARPVLVNVWATWCAPCKEELPLLAEYAAEPGSIPVVGLVVQSKPADALELLDALDVRLPAVLDERGTAAEALRLPPGLPASYVVAEDGTLRLVENPRLFRSVAEIRQAVGHP